jgi:precorrin-6A/cobalt-precorrin-6A reductase
MVLYGTKEAREIITALKNRGYMVMAAAVTEYGKTVLGSRGIDEVFIPSDPLNMEQELAGAIAASGVRLILDATHPWPGQLSDIARKVARDKGISYIRYARSATSLPEHSLIHRVNSWEEAARLAGGLAGTIFLTTGSNNLEVFLRAPETKNRRIVVRILPEHRIVKKCQDLGMAPRDLVALQGPFSVKLNQAIFRAYRAGVVVTRDSGSTDTSSKIKAALGLKIPVVIITELIRPKTPASVGGGFQTSMDSANIQRGLNPPLNEVSFNRPDCGNGGGDDLAATPEDVLVAVEKLLGRGGF